MRAILLLALAFVFLGHLSVVYPYPDSQRKAFRPPPLRPPPLQLSVTAAEEVKAAQQLLRSLLGTDSNVNITALIPPGTDPCVAKPLWSSSSNFSYWPFLQRCGPQPQGTTIGRLITWLDPCPWSWLSCTNGHIVAIDLSCSIGDCKFPLRGSLPVQGPNLPKLMSLDISGNVGLTGTLDMSNWTVLNNLMLLNMSHCQFEGQLPDNWDAVPELRFLDLGLNRFSGTLPPGMSGMQNLELLQLRGNSDLAGYLPRSWEGLTELKELDVRGLCRLCGSTFSYNSAGVVVLTEGTHIDARCRPEQCDGGWHGLHDVFQGVMAAFASVLGLTALILVLRRLRDCATARNNARSSARGAGGAAAAATETGDGGSSSVGGRAWMTAGVLRQRSQRQRRPQGGGLLHPVPLYTVELGPDGLAKWNVELLRSNVGHGCNTSSSDGRPEAGIGAPLPQRHPVGQPQSVAAGEQERYFVARDEALAPGEGLPPGGGDRASSVAAGGGDGINADATAAAVPGAVESVEMVVLVGAMPPAALPSLTEDGDDGGMHVGHARRRTRVAGGADVLEDDGGGRAGIETTTTASSGWRAVEGAAFRRAGTSNDDTAVAAEDSSENAAGRASIGAPPPGTLPIPSGATVGGAFGSGSRSGAIATTTTAIDRRLPQPPDAIILMPDGVELCLGRRLTLEATECIASHSAPPAVAVATTRQDASRTTTAVGAGGSDGTTGTGAGAVVAADDHDVIARGCTNEL